MKTNNDRSLLCTECLFPHTLLCEGRRPAQQIAPGDDRRPAIVVPAHACNARLCADHAFTDGGRDFCGDCLMNPENT